MYTYLNTDTLQEYIFCRMNREYNYNIICNLTLSETISKIE